MNPVDEYLIFLWQQFQYDWGWMSNPWVLYTVIPAVLYCVFFFFKWVILLAPVTIPIMTLGWCVRCKTIETEEKSTKNRWSNN